jgi:hypothetical protein
MPYNSPNPITTIVLADMIKFYHANSSKKMVCCGYGGDLLLHQQKRSAKKYSNGLPPVPNADHSLFAISRLFAFVELIQV